jgi:uncharacterized membrane protein
MRRAILVIACAISSMVFVACGGEEEGQTSGATCPTGSALTYDTFGSSFMGQYCTSCHSSALSGSARNGAPSNLNFDTLAALHEVDSEEIDAEAAAGPSSVNTSMPPGEPKPSEAERRLLGEWLACGLP